MFIILFSVLLLPFSSKECSKTDIFSIFEMKSCVGELNLPILKVPINIFVDICFFNSFTCRIRLRFERKMNFAFRD